MSNRLTLQPYLLSIGAVMLLTESDDKATKYSSAWPLHANRSRHMTPIVLVPGLLCSAEVFAPQVAALWPYGPITIASTLDCKTVPEMAAAVLATAPPRFALAGISMGGYICLEIMRQAPERVIKLALLNTSARSDTPEQITQRRALVAQARTGDFEALLTQALSAILHPKHQNDPALREVNARMGLTVGVDGFARQVEAVIPRIDSRPSLPVISVPTLVLVGDRDPLTPPDRAEEMAAAIPNARLVVVPECGHGSTLEQPAAVNRALIEWITG
jgi:pimeloyl-ACP methyl ester carboxylesterase